MIRENAHFMSERNYSVTMKHNQMKLMFQYDIHPRIYLNAGASFNLLKANYQLQSMFHSMNIIYSDTGTPEFGVSSASTNIYTVNKVISPIRPVENSFQTTRMWVSWELGVFYRINF